MVAACFWSRRASEDLPTALANTAKASIAPTAYALMTALGKKASLRNQENITREKTWWKPVDTFENW